jgi:hypothetical protein
MTTVEDMLVAGASADWVAQGLGQKQEYLS